jgi:RNA polymerase sigma-70 factor (ECF subfamily)
MTAESGPSEISVLLRRCANGESEAEAELYERVYRDLKVIAGALFRSENRESSLQPSVIVNEAFLRMPRAGEIDWNGRRHFFAVAARAMRRALVDHARARGAAKRPQTIGLEDLDATIGFPDMDPGNLLDIDAALTKLSKMASRASQVIEMRFFAGMTMEEIAQVLNVSERTIKRDWEDGRVWLYTELNRQL